MHPMIARQISDYFAGFPIAAIKVECFLDVFVGSTRNNSRIEWRLPVHHTCWSKGGYGNN